MTYDWGGGDNTTTDTIKNVTVVTCILFVYIFSRHTKNITMIHFSKVFHTVYTSPIGLKADLVMIFFGLCDNVTPWNKPPYQNSKFKILNICLWWISNIHL